MLEQDFSLEAINDFRMPKNLRDIVVHAKLKPYHNEYGSIGDSKPCCHGAQWSDDTRKSVRVAGSGE